LIQRRLIHLRNESVTQKSVISSHRNGGETFVMSTLPNNSSDATAPSGQDPWQGFKSGRWQTDIDVQDFIQTNYTPYEGDGA
jgi:hypothetical protein